MAEKIPKPKPLNPAVEYGHSFKTAKRKKFEMKSFELEPKPLFVQVEQEQHNLSSPEIKAENYKALEKVVTEFKHITPPKEKTKSSPMGQLIAGHQVKNGATGGNTEKPDPAGKTVGEKQQDEPSDLQEKEKEERRNLQDTLIEETKKTRGEQAAQKLKESFEVQPLENFRKNATFSDAKYGVRSDKTTPEVFKQSAEKRLKSLTAEKNYFDALKAYHSKKKTLWNLFKGNFVDTKKDVPSQIQRLKDTWQAVRRDEVISMRNDIANRYELRHKDKDGKEKGPVGTSQSKADKKLDRSRSGVMERYDRRYGRAITLNATIEAKKAEFAVRESALSDRALNGIEVMSQRFKNLPPAVRIGLTYAIMTGGAIAAGAALTGGGLVVAPLALVLGGSAALVRWRAAKKDSKFWARAARFMTVGGVAGLLGEGIVRTYHHMAQTESKALEKKGKLEDEKSHGLQKVTTSKMFDQMTDDWEKAMLTRESVIRQERLGGAVGSIVGGLLIGGALHHEFSNVDTLHQGAGHVPAEAPSHHGAAGHQAEHSPHGAGSHQQGPAQHPNAQPSKEVSDSLKVGDKADGVTINDADKLLGHFAKQLHDKDGFQPGDQNAPPAIQKLFEELHANKGGSFLHGEDHASIKLGFEGKHGLAAVLHPGDKISLDHGRIIIDSPGHPHYVLIDEKGTIHPIDPKSWHMMHTHMPGEHHGAHHEAAPTSQHGAQASEAAANAAQTEKAAPVTAGAASILPAGMDPNSAQASDWLNAHHQPGVEQQPVQTAQPAPEATQTEAPQQTEANQNPDFAPTNHHVGPSYTHSESEIPPGTLAGVIHNSYGTEVNVNETHLYTVSDADTGNQHLVAYGANGSDQFVEKLQTLAKDHPGKDIYVDSPAKTPDVNGVDRPFVTIAHYDPQSGFSIGVTPPGDEFFGVKLNPNTFTNQVE